MTEEEWLDVATAAQRYGCSPSTIRRKMRHEGLPARKERGLGRDGRPVLKSLISVSDLDDAFGVTARREHERKVRESAPPLTDEQKSALRDIFLLHLRTRGPQAQPSSQGEMPPQR